MSDHVRTQLRLIDLGGVIVCVGLAALIYLGAVDPYINRSANRATRQEEFAQQSQAAANLARVEMALGQRLAEARRKLAENPVVLEPVSRTNHRMAGLNALAAQAGLEIDEARVEGTRSGPHYLTVPIHLQGRGATEAAVRFLRLVNETYQDTAVTSFELSGNPGLPGARAKMVVDLAWYAAAGSE